MSNTIKVTISGSYHSANKQIENFDSVTGIMPPVAEDKATQMAIRRYAKIWVAAAKKEDGTPMYKNINNMRKVGVDSVEDNEDNPRAYLSYVGKDIMQMNYEELQDLATANDLNDVPLYKSGDLRNARRIAFSEYAIKVLELEEYGPNDEKEKYNLYNHRSPGFNPAHFEPIIADAEIRRFDLHRATIEDGIQLENKPVRRKGGKPVDDAGVGAAGSRMTLKQLQQIAEQRNVPFNKGISYENLHKKVYGKAA